MKAVKVQYTVKPEYVERNKANIKAVMDYIKAYPIEGMYYASYQLEDKNTFMHVNVAKDDETMSKLNDVEAFDTFRTELKASSPLAPPKQEPLELAGASWEI